MLKSEMLTYIESLSSPDMKKFKSLHASKVPSTQYFHPDQRKPDLKILVKDTDLKIHLGHSGRLEVS